MSDVWVFYVQLQFILNLVSHAQVPCECEFIISHTIAIYIECHLHKLLWH